MGTYLYTLRKKTCNISIDGVIEKVNFYSYFCKPHWSSFNEDKVEKMGIQRCHNLWKDQPLPKYVVHADPDSFNEPRDSYYTPLYAVYNNARSIVWYDSDHFPGTLFGYIKAFKDFKPQFISIEEAKIIQEDDRARGIRDGFITELKG